jgi:hypothetical protein
MSGWDKAFHLTMLGPIGDSAHVLVPLYSLRRRAARRITCRPPRANARLSSRSGSARVATLDPSHSFAPRSWLRNRTFGACRRFQVKSRKFGLCSSAHLELPRAKSTPSPAWFALLPAADRQANISVCEVDQEYSVVPHHALRVVEFGLWVSELQLPR